MSAPATGRRRAGAPSSRRTRVYGVTGAPPQPTCTLVDDAHADAGPRVGRDRERRPRRSWVWTHDGDCSLTATARTTCSTALHRRRRRRRRSRRRRLHARRTARRSTSSVADDAPVRDARRPRDQRDDRPACLGRRPRRRDRRWSARRSPPTACAARRVARRSAARHVRRRSAIPTRVGRRRRPPARSSVHAFDTDDRHARRDAGDDAQRRAARGRTSCSVARSR